MTRGGLACTRQRRWQRRSNDRVGQGLDALSSRSPRQAPQSRAPVVRNDVAGEGRFDSCPAHDVTHVTKLPVDRVTDALVD